jgi:pantetheine-phosphate adenylyltransferase
MPKVAVYAGSFDPITNGHRDLIQRSLRFVDRLVVALAVNVNKQPLFTVEERIEFIRLSVEDDPRIEVRFFEGLLVDFMQEVGATLSIRGIRAVSDFEYEYQMAMMNRHLADAIETVFMVPSIETTYVSSSLVRQVARFRGDVRGLVHPRVADALAHKFATA